MAVVAGARLNECLAYATDLPGENVEGDPVERAARLNCLLYLMLDQRAIAEEPSDEWDFTLNEIDPISDEYEG